MMPTFPTDMPAILDRLSRVQPAEYARTRNFVEGAVTYLSPYISRGVLSTRQVLDAIIARNTPFTEAETLVRELAWRDYFQRVWQHKNINQCIRQAQQNVAHHALPTAVLEARTGITGIDESIQTLYQTGYMHNHCRMYVAAVTCNTAQAYWHLPAQWLYYHLLDGDWASNACSWQWVAGCNSSKKYVANQENISKYTHTPLQQSFLNLPYEALADMPIPDVLHDTTTLTLETKLPVTPPPHIDKAKPTLLYNYYNLDPAWKKEVAANRVLLLEPTVFADYPVSEKCLNFALELAHNIPDIQIFTGSFAELGALLGNSEVYYKEHPLNHHYTGHQEPRDWMDPTVNGYFPSFFGYWKKIEKNLRQRFAQ